MNGRLTIHRMLVGLTLLAFTLRLYHLAAVPLRWDEGWSIALGRLAPAEIARLTALDVHPPLYYWLLAPWLALGGAHEYWTRFFSAACGTLAVPLIAVAARAWWRQTGSTARAAAVCAALGAAIAPPLVYYAGVTRMYALTTPFLGLAVWGLARLAPYGRRRTTRSAATTHVAAGSTSSGESAASWATVAATVPPTESVSESAPVAMLAAVLGATGALYSFYYSGFAIAGLFAAALVAWPRVWRRWLATGLSVAVIYLPWLAYAMPLMLARIGERTASEGISWSAAAGLVPEALRAALFVEAVPTVRVAVPLVVFVAGVLVGRPGVLTRRAGRRSDPRPMGRLGLASLAVQRTGLAVLAVQRLGLASRPVRLLGLAVLPVAAVLVGAALGAQAHMFQARYTIVATPFAVLGLGWAAAALWRRGRLAGLLAGAALLAAFLPSLGGYVYERAAEVSGPYDPSSDWRELAPHSAPEDLVAFNILSLAGAYERYRTPQDPPWTYGQVWDPVREAPGQAIARVSAAAAQHGRLWLVLYKGTYSPGSAALKSWADAELYPVEGWWKDDTLYQGYVTALPERGVAPNADFGHGVLLANASLTAQVTPGHGIAVNLEWRATRAPDADARVFVHAYRPDGRLVAQHDGFPAYDTRPPTSWKAGDTIYDRHGLYVPSDEGAGPLKVVVGLYDPATGSRWPVVGGGDSVTLGEVAVAAR